MNSDRIGGPIRWRLHLNASPKTVYAALATPAGRAAFWAESAQERGDQIEFCFINGERHLARVLERSPHNRFVLEYMGGPAAFELTPDGNGGTDLLLNHDGVANDEWIETHAGWLNVLFPLKAWLDHGVDLRNHDPQRGWEQGYVDQ